eukprot:PhF_6_TR31765/c0_g1_i1/m.46770
MSQSIWKIVCLCCLVFVLFLDGAAGSAMSTWTQHYVYPYRFFGHTCNSWNSIVYCFAGFDGVNVKNVMYSIEMDTGTYDPLTPMLSLSENAAATVSPYVPKARVFHAAIFVRGKLHVIGGRDDYRWKPNPTIIYDVVATRLNPYTDTYAVWDTTDPRWYPRVVTSPDILRQWPCLVTEESKIYMFAGTYENVTERVARYYPNVNITTVYQDKLSTEYEGYWDLNDLWVLDTSTSMFAPVPVAGLRP